jgi:hypothetical protein
MAMVLALPASAETTARQESGAVMVLGRQGIVQCSTDGRTWESLPARDMLKEGMFVRTARQATVDLLLAYNGSVFRLASDSELRVEQLRKNDTGVDMVTETRLKVVRGNLVGSQRKLHKPSVLEIETANGRAFIRGTEYVVNAQGAVSVLSGSVEINYNLPGNKGSIKVTIQAGYSFDPATGTVVPTTPAYLQNLIADVNAVRQNAEVYHAGGATIVVRPDVDMSPTTPHGNNGVGNGEDPQPPGNPPINDGPGTGPGHPGRSGRSAN